MRAGELAMNLRNYKYWRTKYILQEKLGFGNFVEIREKAKADFSKISEIAHANY